MIEPVTIPDLTADRAIESHAAASDRGEAVRYFVSSVIALSIDVLVLSISVRYSGLPLWLSGAVAYLVGLVAIYLFSIYWVFSRRAMQKIPGEFAVFALLGTGGLMLNSATLYLVTTAGVAIPAAKVVSAGIGFVANFVSRKVILFSKRS